MSRLGRVGKGASIGVMFTPMGARDHNNYSMILEVAQSAPKCIDLGCLNSLRVGLDSFTIDFTFIGQILYFLLTAFTRCVCRL